MSQNQIHTALPTEVNLTALAEAIAVARVEVMNAPNPFYRGVASARLAGLYESWLLLTDRDSEARELIGDTEGTTRMMEDVFAGVLDILAQEEPVRAAFTLVRSPLDVSLGVQPQQPPTA